MEFVDVHTQAEMDEALKRDEVIPVCRGKGYFCAYGSATVSAYDSATVRASGSATVRASGSATVSASGSATVSASRYVAVHKHGSPNVTGGVIIEVPEIETAEQFIDYYGIKISRGRGTVYKLVDDDWKSDHGAVYEPGTTTGCDDWSPVVACGQGLHFSPRPFMADQYSSTGTRYVECTVKVADIVVLGDKIKAPSCKNVRQVDADGQPVVLEPGEHDAC